MLERMKRIFSRKSREMVELEYRVAKGMHIGNNCHIYSSDTIDGIWPWLISIGDNVTIYSGTTILGGETVIGNGATIGGNAFIVNSVSEGMKVSVRNPELQFSLGSSGEQKQEEFWDWVI